MSFELHNKLVNLNIMSELYCSALLELMSKWFWSPPALLLSRNNEDFLAKIIPILILVTTVTHIGAGITAMQSPVSGRMIRACTRLFMFDREQNQYGRDATAA